MFILFVFSIDVVVLSKMGHSGFVLYPTNIKVLINPIDNLIAELTIASSQIARLMGPTWDPSGADRTQVGPMLIPWTLLSGILQFQPDVWISKLVSIIISLVCIHNDTAKYISILRLRICTIFFINIGLFWVMWIHNILINWYMFQWY